MANLTTRSLTVSTVSTDNLNKGSALTIAEMDSNFLNLNTDKLESANGTFTGDLTVTSATSSAVGSIKLLEAADNGTESITIKAPASLAANLDFVLPSTAGTSGYVLTTDGAGTLSWAAGGSVDLSSNTTDDLAEGSTNLYFSGKTTDDLTQGSTNLYYADSLVDAHLTGGTGVTYTAGEIAIGQDVGTTADVTFNTVTATSQFEGDLNGAILLAAKNVSGGTIYKGQAVYVNGLSGDTPTVILADASDPAKMPALGVAQADINNNATGEIVTLGNLYAIDTSASNQLETGITLAVGDVLYISATEPGNITNVAPAGESNQIQNIGKAVRVSPNTNMTYKIHGAGRSAATPALDSGNIFIGNGSNQTSTTPFAISLDTTPQLGGDLDVNGNDIVSVSNGDIAIAPNGTGSVKLDNNVKVQGGATDGRYLVVDNFDGATPITFGYNSPGITIASKGTGDNRDFPGMILHSSSSSSSAYSSIWIQRNKNDDPGTTGYLADNERVFAFYGSADRGGFYFNQMAGIEYRSSEAHSASAQGGKIEFYTMPNGTNSYNGQTKKMTIDEDVEIHDHMVLHNQSGDPSTVTDASHIYAKDDASSSEVYVRDEAGNITKISPHNEQGEWEYFSRNVKTGKTVRINMEEMIRDIEQLTGKTYIKDE